MINHRLLERMSPQSPRSVDAQWKSDNEEDYEDNGGGYSHELENTKLFHTCSRKSHYVHLSRCKARMDEPIRRVLHQYERSFLEGCVAEKKHRNEDSTGDQSKSHSHTNLESIMSLSALHVSN